MKEREMVFQLLATDPIGYIGLVVSVISVVIGLPGFISAIIFAVKRWSIGHFYKTFFSTVIDSRKPNREERKRFMNYVKPSFSQIIAQDSHKDVSYDEFIKSVENTKITIVMGVAGIGKSILMQRIAAKFRSKIQKGNRGDKLEEYGILFRKLDRESNLNRIIDEIKEKVKNDKVRYSVYLDGLDELSALNKYSGSKIFNDLLATLLKGISQECERIVISLRPEILDGGFSANFTDTEDDILFFKVKNFKDKQIMSMYRRENRKVTSQIKLGTYRQNLKKLKLIIAQNKDNIFSYPLILTWANDILGAYDVKTISEISWYDALGTVIQKELEREYQTYKKSKGKVTSKTDYSEDQFIADGKEFLISTALTMALSKEQFVTKETVLKNGAVERYNKAQNEKTGNTFLSRRLLIYVDWSEASNKGHPHYEFIHSMIYWRVLAEALISENTSQDVRAKIIVEQSQNATTPLMQYCYQGLWSKCDDITSSTTVFCYRDYSNYMLATQGKVIKCKIPWNIPLPLEIILTCFYDMSVIIDSVAYNIHIDGVTHNICEVIELDSVRIREFVNNRRLDLSNLQITNVNNLLKWFSKDSFDVLDCSNTDVTQVTIPGYVKEFTFKNCQSLEKVVLSDGISVISDCAFGEVCIENIADGKIPIQAIGCHSLTSITIPDSVTKIGFGSFADCRSLTSVVIPDRVTSIGDYAFLACISLISVTFAVNSQCTNIDSWAFFNCSSLTSITIPNSVTNIGDRAFGVCDKLASINYLGTIESWCKIEGLEKLMYYGTSSKTLSLNGRFVTELVIPSTVTSIPAGAFCKTNITSVTFEENSQWISLGGGAFYECSSLTSITIPDNVIRICENTFDGCSSLQYNEYGNAYYLGSDTNKYRILVKAKNTSITSCTIHENTWAIYSRAFYECSSLKAVYYVGTASDWTKKIRICSNNSPLTSATRYYYSESEPTLNADGTAYDGNYWHYGANGEIVIWEKV